MLKNILKTNGAQQLSKNELQSINGGKACINGPGQSPGPVPSGHGICVIGGCWIVYHCDDVCPNGTDPICHTGY